jgi:hypothetical protein
MISHASNYTHFAASQTAQPLTIGAGTVKVMGIEVQGTSNGQVVILENDGSTVIMEISVLANTTHNMNTPFVAQNGIKVTTPSGVTCTVFHTQLL